MATNSLSGLPWCLHITLYNNTYWGKVYHVCGAWFTLITRYQKAGNYVRYFSRMQHFKNLC